ncbi:hypothetical protein COA09_31535, partial [Bacillus cereus]
TKEELNKKVEEAQSETNGQFKEVKNSLQEVSQTIKNVQNSQGEINKTVSEIKQTNEGFTKSIESLTKKDGEITEKLNTVEDTVEGTKKTITDIQSDTNGLKKTTTEIKEQAGKTSEKLESVEKKFDDMKFSGRNLLLSTGGTLKSDTGTNISNTVLKSFKFAPDIFEMIRGQEVALSITARTQAFSKGTPSPWIGMELSVTYEDNEQVWLPIRIEDKVATSQGWARYSAVVTIKNKAIKTGYLNSLIRNVKGMVELKEWQIEIGNKATEYRPAAEDQVTTDEFTKRTTEIEKSVDGIKENITKVEQNQTGFDKRVTTVEKNADSISQSVGKVQEIQTQQGKTLSEAASKIEQHSKALELQLKMKDVEDYVGGIGNETVLRNVLWKNDTKYWQLTSNAARDTQVTYKGCNSLSVITAGNASNLYKGASHDYINAGPGWNYVFSAYFYTDNKASIDAGAAIELQCYDVNNKMIKSYLQEITISQGTWIRTHVAGLLIEGTKKVKVLFWVRKNGRLWMAQPMLQIGDKPSSFMENPVDIVDKDKIMEELADKIATEPYNKKVTELERGISATAEGVEITSKKQEKFINETYAAYVKETGSKLKVLDEGILAEVKKGNIIAAINFSSEKLEIDVSKVAINADTMVKWLTAKGIDTNVINVNGDKITIDKNGVTVKMLDFLFEDEWGTKTTVIPKRNLIADHDFSSVPKLNIGTPNYQGFGTGYGLPWKVQG